jgi:DHA2 family multidrug resistance protein-like MFS transporter
MTEPNPQPQSDGLPAPRRYFALAVLLTTLTLVVLDGAIANLALPCRCRRAPMRRFGW